MSAVPQLTVALLEEADIIAARQRTRQVADLLGFDKQDQTRIATAVSEIARNALTYGGGGRVELAIDDGGDARLIVTVRDKGPGIADLAAILEGRYRSQSGMGVGIVGTRRLMDDFTIDSVVGEGTIVTLGKLLPRASVPLSRDRMRAIGQALAATKAADPLAEVRTQNQELLESLAALQAKQDETERLNAELATTNRGVVALHAELEANASAMTALNAELEGRVVAAVAECQQINDVLRQSQKMEAVGQLTGGIAHDFNNLLQIVTGNLEILTRGLPEESERMRRAAQNAMAGAQRAATLTQRLLAFSRRQPLAPKPLDPNQLIDGMSDLITRTLGEQIAVRTDLARDLWPVEADTNQLENAVLNLAVNARDAMAPGGTLTITTGNTILGEGDVEEDTVPGQYVSIAVCDTGAGMSDETMARVFEPFFTTKEVGKGTGLGLSMVYGFVKQSGGHLRIESSVGRGTTVNLYLPRFFGAIARMQADAGTDTDGAGDGEVILLVEDDAGVRGYSADVLGELGYAVIEAEDGESAVRHLGSDARIDLVFSDVVLTGALTGRDVADASTLLRPGVPVLFTSGYARDAIVHNDRLDEGVALLAKPFTFSELAGRLRDLLNRRYQLDAQQQD
ncbi:ATP-binding protein [Sphingomonas sp. 1P08PE]|uniref:ATP-binding protein n=1 Tax=Sphingomonas sp. 1P08PE TaxID=554122 RepID=UPI0039A28C6E